MSEVKDARNFLYEIQKAKNPIGQGITAGNSDSRKNVLDLKILVCVDVSGSICQRQFKQFMQQIELIRGLSVVKVLEVDTQVVALYDYFKTPQAHVMRLEGGGGTEFSAAFKLAEQIKPDCVLFLTDGYVSDIGVKTPSFPVGWILTHEGMKPPYKFGEVVLRLPPVT